jgi:CopG family transcriptional regulator / antitoxin EndoAI
MKTAKTLSITIPPEMLSRAEALAKKENRTMSELVREALRTYERQRWWEQTNAYGRVSANAAGLSSEDELVRPVDEYRAEQPPRRKKRSA